MTIRLPAVLTAALVAAAAAGPAPAGAADGDRPHAAAAKAIPTPKNYRRARGAERAAMVRAARTSRIAEGARRAKAAFIGLIDPSYGFVCIGRNEFGVGVKHQSQGRWKTWRMPSGAIQTYAEHCRA